MDSLCPTGRDCESNQCVSGGSSGGDSGLTPTSDTGSSGGSDTGVTPIDPGSDAGTSGSDVGDNDPTGERMADAGASNQSSGAEEGVCSTVADSDSVPASLLALFLGMLGLAATRRIRNHRQ